MKTRILGISSSLRARSHSRIVVKKLLEHAEGFGGEVDLLDLRETPLGLLEPDNHGSGEHYPSIREKVLWADAFVLCSPDYHGSMSATAKNFLDHFWHEFTGKLFGYVVASHEKGLTVQDQMRTAIRQCYAWSLPYGIGFNGDVEVDREAEELGEQLAERVEMMAHDLVVYGGLIHGQFKADVESEPRLPGFARRAKGH